MDAASFLESGLIDSTGILELVCCQPSIDGLTSGSHIRERKMKSKSKSKIRERN